MIKVRNNKLLAWIIRNLNKETSNLNILAMCNFNWFNAIRCIDMHRQTNVTIPARCESPECDRTSSMKSCLSSVLCCCKASLSFWQFIGYSSYPCAVPSWSCVMSLMLSINFSNATSAVSACTDYSCIKRVKYYVNIRMNLFPFAASGEPLMKSHCVRSKGATPCNESNLGFSTVAPDL